MNLSSTQVTKNLPFAESQHTDIYHELHHREIRLVTLLKGHWSDEIQCRLRHAPLANKPSYKALSYAWGSPKATRPVLVNDCQHQVTVNLESALRRLRRADSEITFWIDAICIDQSNNTERTQQVNLMHDIFSSTEEVIVYLGEAPRDGITASGGPISTYTTVFSCDKTDEDKLGRFHASFQEKERCVEASRRENVDFAVEVFCLLRSLANDEDFQKVAPYFNSQQSTRTRYHRNLFEGVR
jgi:hypothetical protein